MRDEELADLPEAFPLRRVSPAWRALAILGVIGLGVLFVILFVTWGALLQARTQAAATFATPAPAMAWAPPVQANAEPDDAAEPADDPGLPYPVREDLRPPELARWPGQRPAGAGGPGRSPRDRFLAKGEEVWKCPKRQFPSEVVVSADGMNIAFVAGDSLVVGPKENPAAVNANMFGGMAAMGGGPVAANPGGPWVFAGQPGQVASLHPAGLPAWSPDSASVYFADANGRIRRYQMAQANLQVLGVTGDSPAPLPPDAQRIAFVRSRPVPKVDAPGSPAAPDPTEVVLADADGGNPRVLVAESRSSWKLPAFSPNGKRLALVSNRGHEGEPVPQWRVFVLDVDAKDPAATLKPLSPPAYQAGPVAWAPDGKAVVYARSQHPLPPDCSDGELGLGNRSIDLFLYDFDAARETRLTRGGGFTSPSIDKDGNLYYLAWTTGKSGTGLYLRQVPLLDARRFAEREPNPAARHAKAWAALLRRSLDAAGVAADADGSRLTPESLAKVDESFRRLYRETFEEEAPQDVTGLDRQQREVQSLSLAKPDRAGVGLVLGAVRGEYLRRHHGAKWNLSKGPLVSTAHKGDAPDKPADGADGESLFGMIANPFQTAAAGAPADDDDDTGLAYPWSLAVIVQHAEGRTLLLTNDPASAQKALKSLADPELAKGADLLKDRKTAAEAEKVLLGVVTRHEQNYRLALHVGKLLYEHRRLTALNKLMQRQCDREPRDARKYNLLGLAFLETDAQRAIGEFRNALRCDLYYGPAYLNLADAYQESGNANAAAACLRRYLQLLPGGPLAADARRRLGPLPEPNQ
jgi:Tol biopolymer transport system component